MGLSGLIGAGANEGLEDLLARQLLQQQQTERERAQRAQEGIQSQRIDLDTRRQDFDEQSRQEDIQQDSISDMRGQNDRMDARLSRLQGEEDQQSAEAALAAELGALMGDPSLPESVKRSLRLNRVGVKNIGPDALKTTQEREADGALKATQIGAEAEARARAEAKFRPAGDKAEWLIRNGQKVKGTYQPGDEPYDPVAARTAQPANSAEAVDTAREVQRLARELSNHSGMSSAFGVLDSRLPTIRQDTADAENIANSLRAMLTLENMGKMKGVLSDSDMRVLQQASTTLASSGSSQAAGQELARLDAVMSKLTGDTGSGAAPGTTPPAGKKFTIVGVK